MVSAASPAASFRGGATVITRRLPCVGGQPRLVTTWRLSSRIRGRRGRAGVSSLTVLPRGDAFAADGECRRLQMQQTIFNLAVLSGHYLKAGCCHAASPPPSPTDDHRPPNPTVVAEVTCGERRREAFGTYARVAGSFVSVASPAASLGGNRHYSPSSLCGRSTPTCHHWEVVKSDKRKAGQGGSVKPHTMSYREALRTPATVSLTDFQTQQTIFNLAVHFRAPSFSWMLPCILPSVVAR